MDHAAHDRDLPSGTQTTLEWALGPVLAILVAAALTSVAGEPSRAQGAVAPIARVVAPAEATPAQYEILRDAVALHPELAARTMAEFDDDDRIDQSEYEALVAGVDVQSQATAMDIAHARGDLHQTAATLAALTPAGGRDAG